MDDTHLPTADCSNKFKNVVRTVHQPSSIGMKQVTFIQKLKDVHNVDVTSQTEIRNIMESIMFTTQ